jgi:iron complex outermembrane recepter protein
MVKNFLLGTSAIRSAAFVGVALAAAAPAYSQTAPAPGTAPVTADETRACATLPTDAERASCVASQARPDGTPDDAGDPATAAPGDTAKRQAESQEIVVTGSRIRRSVFTSPDPLTVIDPELERKAGRNDTAEILQSSPVASGSFQITPLLSAGSFVTDGGVGAQTLSLRGLGANRTLTLLNGRRAGPAGTRGAVSAFDLNVIPSAAIQSVEILKTGALSIYGSDAIAGVVNLLTKKSTDGLELRAYGSFPQHKGGENYSASAVYGKDFGRGHFLVGVDYTHRNELERGDRDYLLCPEEYIFNRNGDRVDIPDPRTGRPRCNASFANSLQISQQNFPGRPGTVFSSVLFDNSGTRLAEFLPPITNSATLALPAGYFGLPNCLASATAQSQLDFCRLGTGLADPIDPLIYGVTVQPKLNRYTAYADAGFNITDDTEVTGEFLFNRRETESQGQRQLFFSQFSGSGPAGAARPSVVCTAALRATRPNCDPTSAGDPLNNGFVGNYFITPVIGVSSDNSTKVDYYRAVGGLKSKNLFGLLSGWNFDGYVQYSRSDGDYTNGRIFQDAVEQLEFRSRLCQPGQVTRIRGVPCQNIDFTDPRVIAGQFTPEERAYLFGAETGNTLYTQLTGEASVSGNLFSLPAGPVGLALGIQYRRDMIDDQPGEITQTNNVFGQSVAGRTAGHSISKEAYGEIEVPVLRDVPFFKSLTVNGAGRLVNSYSERRSDKLSDSDKGNFTYKVGVNWAVNNWLRLRATQGTSFRSPALFEQFLADQTGFQAQLAIDPCIGFGQAVTNGALDPRIGQRCAALGLAPDRGSGGTSSASVATGGGIGVLNSETSKARTFGVVLTPPSGPWKGSRVSLAVDYFNIAVKGEVTTLGAANIIFTCFNSDNYPTAPECSLFTRDLDPLSARFGQIIDVRNPFLNINAQRNRGVDVTARFSQDMGRYGNLSMLGQMTFQLEDTFELFAGVPRDDNGEISDPRFTGDFQTTYSNGPWSLFYGLTAIGSISNEGDLRFARGGDVCFASVIRGGDICPVYRFKAQFYHNASITRDFSKRFSVTAGVSNLFDKKPPRVGINSPIGAFGQTATSGTQYDLVGRRFFLSGRAKF